jgi:hypothetical protein
MATHFNTVHRILQQNPCRPIEGNIREKIIELEPGQRLIELLRLWREEVKSYVVHRQELVVANNIQEVTVANNIRR